MHSLTCVMRLKLLRHKNLTTTEEKKITSLFLQTHISFFSILFRGLGSQPLWIILMGLQILWLWVGFGHWGARKDIGEREKSLGEELISLLSPPCDSAWMESSTNGFHFSLGVPLHDSLHDPFQLWGTMSCPFPFSSRGGHNPVITLGALKHSVVSPYPAHILVNSIFSKPSSNPSKLSMSYFLLGP